jgi:hypothetical protein
MRVIFEPAASQTRMHVAEAQAPYRTKRTS